LGGLGRLRLLPGAVDGFQDHAAGDLLIAPFDDLDPLAAFQVLVVGEEVLDLLDGDGGRSRKLCTRS
jgi:hypothetical protein